MIISLNLSKRQQTALRKIVKTGNSGKIRISKEQLLEGIGQHFIKLNLEQTKKAMSALNRKKGMELTLSKPQLIDMNRKQSGGFFFLPFLVEAATAAAPYVASAVGSFVAEKAIGAIGDALFGGDMGMEGEGLELYRTPQIAAGHGGMPVKKKEQKKNE